MSSGEAIGAGPVIAPPPTQLAGAPSVDAPPRSAAASEPPTVVAAAPSTVVLEGEPTATAATVTAAVGAPIAAAPVAPPAIESRMAIPPASARIHPQNTPVSTAHEPAPLPPRVIVLPDAPSEVDAPPVLAAAPPLGHASPAISPDGWRAVGLGVLALVVLTSITAYNRRRPRSNEPLEPS